jgi:hypothetical protein
MGFFGGKKNKVLDLSENYHAVRKFKQSSENRAVPQQEDSGMGFLGSMANSSTTDNFSWDNDPAPQVQEDTFPDRKQKMAKRLLDMTNKIEDLSNQIYHLTQRVELLEKKNKVNYN